MFAYQFTVCEFTGNIHDSPKFSSLCLVIPDDSKEGVRSGLEQVSKRDGFVTKTGEEFLDGAIHSYYKNTKGIERKYSCLIRLNPPSPAFVWQGF